MIALLLKRDFDARSKQMARMGREERLARCRLELSTGKSLKLGRLRSFCRPVIFCGTGEQVAAALAAAAPFKSDLLERGVFLVPVVLDGAGDAVPAMEAAADADAKCGSTACAVLIALFRSRC